MVQPGPVWSNRVWSDMYGMRNKDNEGDDEEWER